MFGNSTDLSQKGNVWLTLSDMKKWKEAGVNIVMKEADLVITADRLDYLLQQSCDGAQEVKTPQSLRQLLGNRKILQIQMWASYMGTTEEHWTVATISIPHFICPWRPVSFHVTPVFLCLHGRQEGCLSLYQGRFEAMRWRTSATASCRGETCSSRASIWQKKVFLWARPSPRLCSSSKKPSWKTKPCGERPQRQEILEFCSNMVLTILPSMFFFPLLSISVKCFVGKTARCWKKTTPSHFPNLRKPTGK